MKRKNLAALGLCIFLAAGTAACGSTASADDTKATAATAGTVSEADTGIEVVTAETAAGQNASSGSEKTEVVLAEPSYEEESTQEEAAESLDAQSVSAAEAAESISAQAVSTEASSAETVVTEGDSEQFTERDLTQTPDTSDAVYLTVSDGQDIEITEEGVYVISGTASESTIIVNADDTAKVQLVLDGVSVANSDFPAIYVVEADKVFVTLTGDNSLSVTGSFTADGETNTDAVIFSRQDLVLNGTGSLTVNSAAGNGISCKDDLKITGGTYIVTAASDAFEANDSIRIADGTFTINAGKDAIQADNDEDDTLGYVFIEGGSFTINAGDDGIQGLSTVTIGGGTFDITAAEGIEGTYVTVNDGTINIQASDDGINAAAKSSSCNVVIEINGGSIRISMGAGDTDAIDSNGSIYINGGTVDITAQSPFDFDYSAELNGGTVYVNGEQITSITNSMMGGGMMGGGMMDGQGQMGGGSMGGQGQMGGGMMGGGSMGGFGGGRP